MPEIVFSRKAELDLNVIDKYAADKWGDAQADLYPRSTHVLLVTLGQQSEHWQNVGAKSGDLRRIGHGSYIIFYRPTQQGICTTRLLHQSMLPSHHLSDES